MILEPSAADPFQKIAINQIFCSTCFRKISCRKCKSQIINGDVKVQNQITKKKLSPAVHLRCFEPLFPSVIKPEDIQTNLLSKENRKRVQSWVKCWNSKHLISISAILSQVAVKPHFSIKTPDHLKKYTLPLLIALTYLSLKDVMTNFALVSRFFYGLTFNNFLWKEECFLLYGNHGVNIIIEKFYREVRPVCEEWLWKEIFFILMSYACLECKRLDMEKMRVCPILRKPLCETCRTRDKFRLISLSQVVNLYGGYLAYFLENFSGKYGWNQNHEKVFYRFYVEKCHTAASKSGVKKTRTLN